MDFGILITLIRVVADVFTWILIASSLLSFFVPPYHPVREALDRIVSPFLEPIRRLMPATGGLDFSPVVLYFIVWVLSRALIAIFISLG